MEWLLFWLDGAGAVGGSGPYLMSPNRKVNLEPEDGPGMGSHRRVKGGVVPRPAIE